MKRAVRLGEAFTFVGLGMPSRFAVAWHVGKRDQAHTDAFAVDLRSRVEVILPPLPSD
jgi:hypothetical protein